MSSVIEDIERRQLRKAPAFQAGDRLRVHFQVIEGTRSRIQVFEGVVIRRQGHGARETFTVRKQSFGVGVERTFPLHSPKIDKLEVAARGDVRRAKLYYLRDRVGKRARVAERRWGAADELVVGEDTAAVDAAGVTAEEAEVVEAPPADTAAETETPASAEATDGDAAPAAAEGDAPQGSEPEGDAPEADSPQGDEQEAGDVPDQDSEAGGDEEETSDAEEASA